MKLLIALACILLFIGQEKTAFEFKPGQSIYVAAIKTGSNSADLTAERKAKEEFTKLKTFKLASSPQQADLVYFMTTEYETNQTLIWGIGSGSEDLKNIAVFVVKPDDYKAHKQDLDALRGAALWQEMKSTGHMRGSGQLSKLVKAFHEQAFKKK